MSRIRVEGTTEFFRLWKKGGWWSDWLHGDHIGVEPGKPLCRTHGGSDVISRRMTREEVDGLSPENCCPRCIKKAQAFAREQVVRALASDLAEE